MSLGVKKFNVHYGGKWVSGNQKYKGGRKISLGEIDGDEFCLIDLVKDIEEKTALSNFRVLWVKEGTLGVIFNDADLLYMWGNIIAVKGVCHLYVEEITFSGPQTVNTLSNKEPPTPNIVPTILKDPPVNTKSPSKQPETKFSSPKSRFKHTAPVRRSPRFGGKFRSKFSCKSTKPVVQSDEENETPVSQENVTQNPSTSQENEPVVTQENVTQNHSNPQQKQPAVFTDDDWAIRNLIESTCEGIDDWDWDFPTSEKSDKPVGETSQPFATNCPLTSDLGTLDVISQCTLFGFDSAQAEEQYHSSKDSDTSDDESFDLGEGNDRDGVDLGKEHEFEEESGQKGKADGEEPNVELGKNHEFADFIKETENVYKDDENRKGHDLPKGEMEELHVKQTWPTMYECRKYMRDYAIEKKFEYKQKKNNNTKISLVCKNTKCQWRVYVRRLPHELTAMLRSISPEHTCKADDKDENKMAHARWVANEIEQDIRNHKHYKPKDVQSEIWEKHGVKISYHTAYISRIICHERIYGSYSEGYRMCPEIARQIQLKNPGSICTWLRNPYDHTFVSLLVAFKASLDGFINGCRPVLGLDGSFLKGKYGGCVLSVVSLDGNNGIFPIAIYVCRGEDYANWSHFLSSLKPHLIKHKFPLTFISDRAKGLRAAVQEVFPDSHHRFCFRHLYRNFKGAHPSHKGEHMETLTWGAARAYKKEDHEKWMAQLEKADKEGTAKVYMCSEPYTSWARSYFDTTSKSEHITNNFSEYFNKMMLTLRDMPLTKLIEKYQLLVMSLLYDRRVKASEMDPDGLVPTVEATIAQVKKNYNKYTTAGSTDYLYVALNKHGKSWTVDLSAMTCSCCEWQISGVPCVHAIAVILPKRQDWRRYCSEFFTTNTYRATYDGHVIPMEDSSYWPQPQHSVKPPPLVRPPGRPRYNRIPGADEVQAPKRGKKKCSKCGEYGHNKSSCKGAPVTDSNRRIVKKTVPAEGPSNAQAAQVSRPPLIIPSMPIPRSNAAKTNAAKKNAAKRPSTSNKGGTASKRGRKIFKPPGPAPPPPGI